MEYEEQISIYKPFSLEAEQAVVGGILIEEYRAIGICEVLTSDDFYWQPNKLIFSAIEFCIENNQPLDVVILSEHLEAINQLEEVGGLGYLAELAHNTPSAANVMAYAKVVRDKKKERDVLSMASEMVEEIKADEGTSQDKVNNALSVVTNFDHEDEKELTFEDHQKNYINTLNERAERGGGLTGYSTSFRDIDARLNGLQKSDLFIVAARPGQGKTTYALNIVTAVARKEHCAIFSMEMSGEQLVEKMYAQTGLNMGCLKTGKLNDSESAMINNAAIKTKALKLTIDDRGALTPQQIRAKCLNLKRKHKKLGVIMVDYIQLMRVNKSQNRTDEVTQISGALKALAKEMDCTVIALSQLSRDVEKRSNKHPVMSDLRDSGSIEQDADIIQFIYRDDYYAEQESRVSNAPQIAEIITSKFRGGVVGKDFLKTELQYSRFIDGPENYQQQEPEQQPKPYKKF